MGSLKQSYLFKLLKSILIISSFLTTLSFGSQAFYNIHTIVYGEGKVVPGLNVKVKEGGHKKVKFKPDTLYAIDSVLINEVNVGNPMEITFENVLTDQNISVYFSIDLPETSYVLSKIHAEERDTIISKDIYINWQFDTIVTTIYNEMIYDTIISILETYYNDSLLFSSNDTVIDFYDNEILKKLDTLSYSNSNDMTSIYYETSENEKVRVGFIAGPNPYIVENGELIFRYTATQPISNASLMIYNNLGDFLDEVTAYGSNSNGVIFRWNGVTNDGKYVKASTVLAIVQARLFDGSIDKAKLVIGIKK